MLNPELTWFDRFGFDTARRTAATLRAHGIFLTDWEKLVLETSMYYINDFFELEPSAAETPAVADVSDLGISDRSPVANR